MQKKREINCESNLNVGFGREQHFNWQNKNSLIYNRLSFYLFIFALDIYKKKKKSIYSKLLIQ